MRPPTIPQCRLLVLDDVARCRQLTAWEISVDTRNSIITLMASRSFIARTGAGGGGPCPSPCPPSIPWTTQPAHPQDCAHSFFRQAACRHRCRSSPDGPSAADARPYTLAQVRPSGRPVWYHSRRTTGVKATRDDSTEVREPTLETRSFVLCGRRLVCLS